MSTELPSKEVTDVNPAGADIVSTTDSPPALPAQFQGKEDAVAYSTSAGLWQFEDIDTGLNYEYNTGVKLWLPVADENAEWMLKSTYEEAPSHKRAHDEVVPKHTESEETMGSQETTGSEESTTQDDAATTSKKPKLAKPSKAVSVKKPPERKNTAVYVSNLPLDVTVQELDQTFSRFGVIAEDLMTGEKRIKIYTDETTGQPKGDALVIFFKPESVHLAIQMLDDTELRYGSGGQRIKLVEATFKAKSDTHPRVDNGQDSNNKPELSKKQKNKIKQKYQDLNNRLTDWDGDADDTIAKRDHDAKKRWEKVVIIKHVFTLEELAADKSEAFEIQQDMLEGCQADIGPVTNVTLFDLEPEGVVSVKFKEKKDAIKCVQVMNGRFFGGRQLQVSIYDGEVKYRKTKKADSTLDEDEEFAEQQRLEDYAKFLESQDGKQGTEEPDDDN